MALSPRLIVRLPAPAFRSEGSIGVNINARWLDPVRFVATTGTLGALVNGATYAGLTLATGDRFLYQPTSGGTSTPGITNGVYVVGAGAPTRAVDADTGAKLFNASVYVNAGTPGAGQSWINVNSSVPNVGTDTIIFRQFDTSPDTTDVHETRTVAAASTIPTARTMIQTLAYATAGDGGDALYKKVSSPPSHPGKFQSADGAWWEIVPVAGAIRVKQFGAIADGTTNNATALQNAIDTHYALACQLEFGVGTYGISTGLSVPTIFNFAGKGKNKTTIKALSAMTAMLALPTATGSTNDTSRSIIDGITFDGNSLAQYGIRGVTNHTSLRQVFVWHTTLWAIDLSYGWCNMFDDCELSFNTGGGFRGASSQNNANTFMGCKIFANDGIGVMIRDSYAPALINCTIELNKVCGIFFEFGVVGFVIEGTYFEGNAQTGYTFTTPATTIKADIIINGATPPTMGFAVTCSGVISGAMTSATYADYFCYAPGADGLTIDGVNLHAGTAKLLGYYGSSSTSPSFGGPKNLQIGINPNFETQGILDISPLTGTILNYASGVKRVYSRYASKRNLAEPELNLWGVVTGSGGTWQRSATLFDGNPDVPVWEINYASAGSSATYGFSVNTANFPEHLNKFFVFGCWTKHTFSNDGNARIWAASVTNTSSNSADQSWTYQACAFKWPASGTLIFGISKLGAAGTVMICCPVLGQLGGNLTEQMEAYGKQTRFKGASSAAPTVGTWKAGDIVERYPGAASGVASFLCTAAGAPGTWKNGFSWSA